MKIEIRILTKTLHEYYYYIYLQNYKYKNNYFDENYLYIKSQLYAHTFV